jgi:hypothetical protein
MMEQDAHRAVGPPVPPPAQASGTSLEQIPFASERERVKMLVKTKSWSRFREQTRAEAALALLWQFKGAF